MDEESKRRIDDLLRAATRRGIQRKSHTAERIRDMDNFERQFRLLRREVINPIFEEAKGYLEREGYAVQIS